jgi:hypothetical protein
MDRELQDLPQPAKAGLRRSVLPAFRTTKSPFGQNIPPKRNSFPSRELRHVRNRLLSRSVLLTLVDPGNMLKFFRFTIVRAMTP